MILRPYPAALMRAYPVDVRVGNVRNNGPALLEKTDLAA
jgi:putative SOS response-associated peptidase YedK